MGAALQSPPRSRAERFRAAYRRIPPRWRTVLGLVLLFVVAFSLAILPLFTLKGTVRAEIAGMQSSTGVAGQPTTVDLGIDNVGDRVISPICLSAQFDQAVTVQRVVFQGLDSVPLRNGLACGGQLAGQQTISVQLVLVSQQATTLHLRLVAAQDSKEIGPAVFRTVEITAP